MNPASHKPRHLPGSHAFTLIEVLIAAGLGSLLSAVVVALLIYGTRCFQSLGNYSDLDSQSRNALDLISQRMRQSTALIDFSSSPPVKSLTVTNMDLHTSLQVLWSTQTKTLSMSENGAAPVTLLTQCDSWDFSLYSRAPNVTSTNITFYSATNGAGVLDATRCKLVDMTWKCSRTILGSKINTESIQTAQIVFRNKIR